MNRRVVLAATLFTIGLAGMVAGCSSNNESGRPKGSLSVSLGAVRSSAAGAGRLATFDPEDALSRLRAASVTISGIEARLADGTWVPVETGLPTDVEVIANMFAGSRSSLPADLLPAGDYDALEMRMTRARLTRLDGTNLTIAPTGTGWTVLIPVSFSVVPGRSTAIHLRLHCASSFKLFDGEFGFEPEIELGAVEHD